MLSLLERLSCLQSSTLADSVGEAPVEENWYAHAGLKKRAILFKSKSRHSLDLVVDAREGSKVPCPWVCGVCNAHQVHREILIRKERV